MIRRDDKALLQEEKKNDLLSHHNSIESSLRIFPFVVYSYISLLVIFLELQLTNNTLKTVNFGLNIDKEILQFFTFESHHLSNALLHIQRLAAISPPYFVFAVWVFYADDFQVRLVASSTVGWVQFVIAYFMSFFSGQFCRSGLNW